MDPREVFSELTPRQLFVIFDHALYCFRIVESQILVKRLAQLNAEYKEYESDTTRLSPGNIIRSLTYINNEASCIERRLADIELELSPLINPLPLFRPGLPPQASRCHSVLSLIDGDRRPLAGNVLALRQQPTPLISGILDFSPLLTRRRPICTAAPSLNVKGRRRAGGQRISTTWANVHGPEHCYQVPRIRR